jgi:hypothetical protein
MHSMKAYWDLVVHLHSFLTSTLDGGDWSNLHPSRFNPVKVLPVPLEYEALYA